LKYIKIPNTDLTVSAVCMGTGEIGSKVDWDQSFRLFDIMFENGGNFIDTAKVYGDWNLSLPKSISERIVGEWIFARGLRKQIVLATKGCISANMLQEDNNCRPETIIRHIEWSLDTLRTDCIDIWYIHKDDLTTPINEIMDCLYKQVVNGKIKYYGVSNMLVGRMKHAQKYATSKGIPNFCMDQSLWNAAVLKRYPYDDCNATFMNSARYNFHKRTGMAFCAYQSTAYGLFHRFFTDTVIQMNEGFRKFYDEIESFNRYRRMLKVTKAKGISLTEGILGYIYCQPHFVCIPIVGAHKTEQVLENFKSGDVDMTHEDILFIEDQEKFGWE